MAAVGIQRLRHLTGRRVGEATGVSWRGWRREVRVLVSGLHVDVNVLGMPTAAAAAASMAVVLMMAASSVSVRRR